MTNKIRFSSISCIGFDILFLLREIIFFFSLFSLFSENFTIFPTHIFTQNCNGYTQQITLHLLQFTPTTCTHKYTNIYTLFFFLYSIIICTHFSFTFSTYFLLLVRYGFDLNYALIHPQMY